MTLADKIKKLRGDLNFLEFANKTKVNRQTLTELEEGDTCKKSTLEQIAKACNVSDEEWIDLLIAWIRAMIGDEDFRKIYIRPFHDGGGMILNDRTVEPETMLREFQLLNSENQDQIYKAMRREVVLKCLPSINSVYDQIEADKAKEADKAASPEKGPKVVSYLKPEKGMGQGQQ